MTQLLYYQECQGTVLGPLLFLCYINDLPRSIKSEVRVYADNTLVYNVINSVDDCISSFKVTYSYFYWKSGQISGKCLASAIQPFKMQILSGYKQEINSYSFVYHINEVPIKAVQHAKYLGVTIDSKLMWKKHIKITTHN